LGRSDAHGINAFLHTHDHDDSLDWDNPDVRRIAEIKTGTLVDKSIEVKPGMNRVLSYLDVATKDEWKHHVAEALDAFERDISAELPLVKVIDRVAIRFDAQAGLPPSELLQEFQALKERVAELLARAA
jgi:hypothetical protein